MENTDYQIVTDSNNEAKRPSGLIALCILTFLGSGIMFLGYFYSFAFYYKIPDQMDMAAAIAVDEQMSAFYTHAGEVFANTPRYIFLVSTLIYLCSICGAAIMLAMRKIGFHIYAIAQILVVFLPQLLTKEPFTFINVILGLLALAFVALYSLYYKKMK